LKENFWYHFFTTGLESMSVFMSQERNEQHGERDISRTATEGTDRLNEGFEGMNYEQIRQPYNPRHKPRNSSRDERNETNRPDGS
jgi:hypothetical protein